MDGPYREKLLTQWLPIVGDGGFFILALSLVVLLPVGFLCSRLLPVARVFGLVIGGLFAVAYLVFVLDEGIEPTGLPAALGKTAILTAAIVSCVWIALPFIYPFWRFLQLVLIWLFQKPPHQRISFSEPFRTLSSAIVHEFGSMKQRRRQRRLLSERDKERRRQESERNRQQIYACEEEARETLRELLDRPHPSPNPNAETKLKWLHKAREKIRLEYADDPVALGEALDRIDAEIRELEQASLPQEPATIDLPLLDEAIKRHPKNAALYIERGNYYLNTANDSYKAVAEFKHSLLLLRDYPAAHHALGMAYVGCQQTRKGVHHLREALRLDPDFAPAREKLAGIHQTQHSGVTAWIGKLFDKSRKG